MSPASIVMLDYQESVTTGQTDRHADRQTDRQMSYKVIPMCRYASQAIQKEVFGQWSLCHSQDKNHCPRLKFPSICNNLHFINRCYVIHFSVICDVKTLK